jgi:hypothetical protein
MLHFKATGKALKLEGIEPVMYVSEPAKGQRLHDWYVTYTGNWYSPHGLLLFIHARTLMTVVVKAKTIEAGFPKFRKQLQRLMKRFKLPPAFIETEMSYANDYIIGKASDRSLAGKVAQVVQFVRIYSHRFDDYRSISTKEIEDLIMTAFRMRLPYSAYQSAYEYWSTELFRVKRIV